MPGPQPLKSTFLLDDISEDGSRVNSASSTSSSLQEDDDVDYRTEVDVGDFAPEDIKVIVGRNRIRVIGEKTFGSLEGTNGFHKIIQVPTNVDVLSLTPTLKDGKVVVTGKYAYRRDRKWAVNKGGLLTVRDDGCTRITIAIPKGISPSEVKIKTVTKHYLVVSNASENSEVPKSPRRCSGEDIAMDFVETFELPSDCDLQSLTKRTMGDSAVVVEFESQSKQTRSASTVGHRPRSFTF